jgi:hypothetical protein
MDWLDEYERLLKAPGAYQDALSLKAQHYPLSLFKYRSVTARNLDALQRDYVWAGAPKTMNDPYDSYCKADWSRLARMIGRKNLRASLAKFEQFVPKFSDEDIARCEAGDDPLTEAMRLFLERTGGEYAAKASAIMEVFANVTQKNIIELTASTAEMARMAAKVASFSTVGTDVTMWAHYTDNHKGYCVEYDFRTLPPNDMRLRHLYPVLYAPSMVDATFMFEPAITMGPNDLTVRWPIVVSSYKSESWRYEKEWRLIHTAGPTGAGIALLVPPARSVYLGLEIEAPDVVKISAIAKSKGAKIFRMQRGDDPAHLIAVEVENGS